MGEGRKHLYRHNCDKCRFLGTYTFGARFDTGYKTAAVDLYVCGAKNEEVIIGRFSSAIPDYIAEKVETVKGWYFLVDGGDPKTGPAKKALREGYLRNLHNSIQSLNLRIMEDEKDKHKGQANRQEEEAIIPYENEYD